MLLVNILSAQTLTQITTIGSGLQESSGLLYLNGKLITHNDSGGEPALFEMDTTNGTQTRKIIIQNATNIDWEDIAMDNDFIYIGDFGNNQGARTNLRIYKISKLDYLANDTVLADTIQFNYSDQTNFTPTNFSTNYDAEALISLGDSLYIFTKNWGNLKTYIYPVNKMAGQHSLNRTDSLNPQGYITGAVYDSVQHQLILIGYTFNSSFVMKLNNWSTNFSGSQITRTIIQPNSSIQIEGVAQIDSFHYFISSENFQNTVSELHIYDSRFPTRIGELKNKKNIHLYPNPVKDVLYLFSDQDFEISMYSNLGLMIKRSNEKSINVSELPRGIYHIQLRNNIKTIYRNIIIQ